MERGYYLLVHEDDLIHALAFILRGVDVDLLNIRRHLELADMPIDRLALLTVDGGICRAHHQNLGGMAGQGQLLIESSLAAVVECGEVCIYKGVGGQVGLHLGNTHAEERELNLLSFIAGIGKAQGGYFIFRHIISIKVESVFDNFAAERYLGAVFQRKHLSGVPA